MASIRKRGTSYQVRISRKGFPAEVKTFDTKAEAERWARSVETAMDSHRYQCTKTADSLLLADLIRRYRETVSPGKRGGKDEAIRLLALERDPMSRYAVNNVTPEVVADYRDRRLKTCCASTVIRDLAALSSIFSHARREWRIGGSNPVADVRKPRTPPGRDRVLTADEERRLLEASAPIGRRSPVLQPLLVVALETAMRRGELLGLCFGDLHLDRRVLRLPLTKNGTSRWVPLSSRAVEALRGLAGSGREAVFPVSVAALDQMFRRLCRRAELQDLRFHDLRHTATTRLANRLRNVIELAAVTGHRSLQMLKRYYHPTAESLATKLG